MERCLTSLVSWEMQIKTTLRYHFTSLGTAGVIAVGKQFGRYSKNYRIIIPTSNPKSKYPFPGSQYCQLLSFSIVLPSTILYKYNHLVHFFLFLTLQNAFTIILVLCTPAFCSFLWPICISLHGYIHFSSHSPVNICNNYL